MNLASLWKGTLETLGMTALSTALAYLVGMPLGILLAVTKKGGIRSNRWVYWPFGIFINIMRSVPCLLLIVILMPLTRLVVGRGSGEWYTMIIPLFASSFGFVARLVEGSLEEVDPGVIEAARSMGASDSFIVRKVLCREARPSLLNGLALSSITIIGYTAFAYDLGAGGLIAEAYSYYANHTGDYLAHPDIWIIVLVIVVLVQLIQESGLYAAKKGDKRRKQA